MAAKRRKTTKIEVTITQTSRFLAPDYCVSSDGCDLDDVFFDIAESDESCSTLLVVPSTDHAPERYFHHSNYHQDAVTPCPLGNGDTMSYLDARHISQALDSLTEADEVVIREAVADPVIYLVRFLRAQAQAYKGAPPALLDYLSARAIKAWEVFEEPDGGDNIHVDPNLPKLIAKADGFERWHFHYFHLAGMADWSRAVPLGTSKEMRVPVAAKIVKTLAALDNHLCPHPRGVRDNAHRIIIPTLARQILDLPYEPYRDVLNLD